MVLGFLLKLCSLLTRRKTAVGLTQVWTGLLLWYATADTLAIPVIPVGVAGICGDRAVLSQGREVQEHRLLVVTLKVLHSWVVKGIVKEQSSCSI